LHKAFCWLNWRYYSITIQAPGSLLGTEEQVSKKWVKYSYNHICTSLSFLEATIFEENMFDQYYNKNVIECLNLFFCQSYWNILKFRLKCQNVLPIHALLYWWKSYPGSPFWFHIYQRNVENMGLWV